jgi:hypothetical protein
MTMVATCPGLRQLHLLLAFLCLGIAEASYSVDLRSDEKDCFLIRVPDDRPSIISGNFDLLEDERDIELNAWLEEFSKHSSVWRSQSGAIEDDFSVTVAPKGIYALCFNAIEEDEEYEGDSISVGFNIRLQGLPRALEPEQEGPDARRAFDLVESAGMIQNDWQNLLDHFDFLRKREAVHTTMTEQILSRVMSWTLIEAALVILMATAQVMYWRKFFEQRRYL